MSRRIENLFLCKWSGGRFYSGRVRYLNRRMIKNDTRMLLPDFPGAIRSP